MNSVRLCIITTEVINQTEVELPDGPERRAGVQNYFNIQHNLNLLVCTEEICENRAVKIFYKSLNNYYKMISSS